MVRRKEREGKDVGLIPPVINMEKLGLFGGI